MLSILIRPQAHDIDTTARRKVPLVFPIDWEHRELTGRDYGIDMILKIFMRNDLLTLRIKKEEAAF